MVDDRARPVAEALGIEVYSYADTVPIWIWTGDRLGFRTIGI
jgi:hypothetical protein